MDSLSGKLLVASPHLPDPNFARTVVLLIHHEDQGAFGLVLNRPSNKNLKALWDEAIHAPCPVDLPVMIGGPLEGPLMAVHANPALSEREIVPGIHFATHKDLLTALVAEGCQPLRVFTGYSGWGQGQLEAELEAGAWTVTDATCDFVFGDEATLWRRVAKHISDEILVEGLRVKHVPEQPWYN